MAQLAAGDARREVEHRDLGLDAVLDRPWPSRSGRSARRPCGCSSRTARRPPSSAWSACRARSTVTPARRAFSIAGTTAVESAGVIRMPFAPSRGHLRERRHLAGVVDVALARRGQQLDVVVVGGVLRDVLASSTKNGFVSRLMMSPSGDLRLVGAAAGGDAEGERSSAAQRHERDRQAEAAAWHGRPPALSARPRRRARRRPGRVRRSNSAYAVTSARQTAGHDEARWPRPPGPSPCPGPAAERAAEDGHDQAGGAELRVLAEPLQGDAVDRREHQRQRQPRCSTTAIRPTMFWREHADEARGPRRARP